MYLWKINNKGGKITVKMVDLWTRHNDEPQVAIAWRVFIATA